MEYFFGEPCFTSVLFYNIYLNNEQQEAAITDAKAIETKAIL